MSIRNAFVAFAAVVGLALTGQPAAAERTLYQKLGERPGIDRIVEDATARWLADDRIKLTFDNINIDRLKKHIADQVCELSGGPCKYTGRDMYQSHKGLHLNTAEFNALAEDLQYAMEKYKIPFGAQTDLLALLAPMQRDISIRTRFGTESPEHK